MRERVIRLRIQLERNDKLGENEKKSQLERKTCFIYYPRDNNLECQRGQGSEENLEKFPLHNPPVYMKIKRFFAIQFIKVYRNHSMCSMGVNITTSNLWKKIWHKCLHN